MFINPIRPVKTRFGTQVDTEIESYVWERLTSITKSTDDLINKKVKEWRRLVRGYPSEEKKSFPWENASNVVIQIIGTCSDIMKAAVMGSIWSILPIYNAGLVGDWKQEENGEEQRNAVEEAMTHFSGDPAELDLYRVESLWFGEAINFGSAFIKTPYEYLTETQVIGVTGEGSNTVLNEQEFVKKYGPHPEKLPFEDFGVDPNASTLEQADFKYHVKHLYKWDIKERISKGLYKSGTLEKIINQPDRFGAKSANQEQKLIDQGITLDNAPVNAIWDIYECWFTYLHNGKKYRLIYPYHFKSRTCLDSTFNFYPDNDDPFRMARHGWDDDGIYGYGMAEMLNHYQEDVSTGHNQRSDNRTLANTSVLRVSRMSNLDSNFSIYPLATIPGEKDEVEVMNLGTPQAGEIQSEQLTLSLAEKRAGIEMGISAPGGGTVNPKKGIYSAQGTFAVMQAGNKRSNMRTTDMRYAHIELGRLILKLYAHFGLGEKGKIFGEKEQFLRKALDNVKSGRLNFPIKAATESINKELEKQNDMLLVNVVKQHHMGIAQMLQAVVSGQVPDPMIKYVLDSIIAANWLMKDLLRAFGKADIDRFLPLPEFLKQGANNGGGNTEAGSSQGNPGSNQPVQQASTIPFSGVSVNASGLPEVSGVSNGSGGIV